MTLTAQERQVINCKNASMSTGPRSDAGKRRARENATRHGLRAEAIPLPNEDPEVVKARNQAWNDYYQPQSPAAQHLVNQCVQATLLADRCHRHHEATLAHQVRTAVSTLTTQREEEVEALKARLQTEPAEAVRGLRRLGAGCRYLLERWD